MQSLKGIKIKTKKVAQKCPIHDINLVQAAKGEAFCPQCVQEQMEREKENLVSNFKNDRVKGMLNGFSLVDEASDYGKTFENFKAEKGTKEAQMGNATFQLAKEYIANSKKPIKTFMYGTPGEGKTHLAMAMLNKINEEAAPPQGCLFVNINTLFTYIKRSFDDPTWFWSEYNAIKKLTEADVLVLDDLGSESSMKMSATEASDYKQGILKQILDKQKRVIVTTNLTFDQLQRVYNPKLVSRLLENSNGRRLNFSGIEDKRLTM